MKLTLPSQSVWRPLPQGPIGHYYSVAQGQTSLFLAPSKSFVIQDFREAILWAETRGRKQTNEVKEKSNGFYKIIHYKDRWNQESDKIVMFEKEKISCNQQPALQT